jgi:hypothetical protein
MRCTLTIDGTKDLVSEYIRVLEFRESMDELDSLAVQLSLPRSESSSLVKKLKPGIPYKLELGSRTAEGDVVRVSLRRSGRLGLQATLFGLEKLHRLRNQRLSEVKEQTRDAVVKTLLDAVGVSATVQGVKPSAAELVFLDDDQLRMLKQLSVSATSRSSGRGASSSTRRATFRRPAPQSSWCGDTTCSTPASMPTSLRWSPTSRCTGATTARPTRP